MYLSLKIVKTPPEDKLIGYFIVVIIVAIIVYFVIGMIVTAVALPSMGLEGLKNFKLGN